MYSVNEFFWRHELLFARLHVLQRHLLRSNLVVAGEDDKGNLLGIGVRHLLLHLRAVRIDLGTNACLTNLSDDGQTVGRFLLAEVNEEHLGGVERILGIEVEGIEHIVDAVDTKRDTHTRQTLRG